MQIKDILERPAKFIKVHISGGKVFLLLTLSFVTILERAVEEKAELERYRKLGTVEELEKILNRKK